MSTSTIETTNLIKLPEEISGEWLGRVLDLAPMTIDSVDRIGTGQMSQSHRVTYTADSVQSSVVVKLASDDETSRATGVGMGAYYA